MKKIGVFLLVGACLLAFGLYGQGSTAELKQDESFFLKSLHYTTNGMAYWYAKEQGGLETLTGIPYPELSCNHCHVSSCDTCHKAEKDNKLSYSTESAQNMEICLQCHARAKAIMNIDKKANQLDVHFAKGMECIDCHTQREIHGDGTEYTSMRQPGAMDAHCEKCHESVTSSTSHKIHRNKLDCNSCHVRHVVSCSNCHFETLVKEGKKAAMPLFGWVFLMNYEGRVTSANMQTFVTKGNKTFLIFAPQNSHSVMKDGRQCNECHGIENVKKVQGGTIAMTWIENGELKQTKGLIPVVDGVTYDFVYHDYKDGKWIPIKNPPKPLLQYAGYGAPLSEIQLRKLAMPMGSK
jgi:hypothetical protein